MSRHTDLRFEIDQMLEKKILFLFLLSYIGVQVLANVITFFWTKSLLTDFNVSYAAYGSNPIVQGIIDSLNPLLNFFQNSQAQNALYILFVNLIATSATCAIGGLILYSAKKIFVDLDDSEKTYCSIIMIVFALAVAVGEISTFIAYLGGIKMI